MQFVLALHSHLPWVLHHGRWPHGSDWLCEAALDTYLPLLEQLTALERDGVTAPITLGITPVLANQLAHPSFAEEMALFVGERLRAAREAPADLARVGETHLIPMAEGWRARIERLYDLFISLDGDLVGAFRRFADADRLEIISSAATHAYLPLLARDESVRLQLAVGHAEHQRLFGRLPRGCWLPECAYHPRGPWTADDTQDRLGTDDHLAAVGFDYFFTDAHQAAAGMPLGAYHDVPLGAERFDAERRGPDVMRAGTTDHSPYRAYDVAATSSRTVRAFVRDPRSSMQVWSRHHGYPGDEWYLEFHKIRWPGGLKLWRVTAPDTDLGDKRHYVPSAAAARAEGHARHFVGLLESIAREQGALGDVIVAPFDTELFGHWWFEGIDFLGACYRRLAGISTVRARTASQHLSEHDATHRLRLSEGSWGAGGDHRMWLNDATRWTWERLWPLEHRFWAVVPDALRSDAARPVLAQATRELLLAQSSDWQFIISTGAVTDYAEQRFTFHCAQAEMLVDALEQHTPAALARAARVAEELSARDDLFPEVLATLARVADGALVATTP